MLEVQRHSKKVWGQTCKMDALKMAMGIPRSSTAQTSAILPPTLVIGAEDAMPAICGQLGAAGAIGGQLTMRPASMVAMLGARADGSVKMK
jgi:hypothetical protein